MSELFAEGSEAPESSSVGGLSIKDEDFEGFFDDFNEASRKEIGEDANGENDEGEECGVDCARNGGGRPEVNGIEGDKDVEYWRTTSMRGEWCLGGQMMRNNGTVKWISLMKWCRNAGWRGE